LERELKGKPTWLEFHHDVVAHARHAGKGHPRKDAGPTTNQWQIVVTVTVNKPRVDEEALRKACFIVGTNELKSEALSDQELVTTYKDQGGVERGFIFSKIRCSWPLRSQSRNRSASSRFRLIMVLCLLVYR
jgi:transposase